MNVISVCLGRIISAAIVAIFLLGAPFVPAQTRSTSLETSAGSPDQQTPIRSDVLTVTLNGRSTQISLAELAAMPQTSVSVHNGHTNTDEHYTGVALADLFTRLGIPQQHGPQQAQLLHSYIRAQGTDNYFVLFSAIEVDRELHRGNVLVALRRNGQALGRDGRFMLVSTEDALSMRSVHNLTSLTLSTVN